jgi:hypothetical protein
MLFKVTTMETYFKPDAIRGGASLVDCVQMKNIAEKMSVWPI